MAQLTIRGFFRGLKTSNATCYVSAFQNGRCSRTLCSSSSSPSDESLTLAETVDFSIHGPSTQGIQGGHDDYLEISEPNVQTNISTDVEEKEIADTMNCHGSVNLHSSMQSNVPEPCDCKIDYAEHYNMPGGGERLYDKYIQEIQVANHPKNK